MDLKDLPGRIAALRDTQPQNLALKHFDAAWFASLSKGDKKAFARCIRSGVENPKSAMGCYAMVVEDYERFAPLFDRVIADHHGLERANIQAGLHPSDSENPTEVQTANTAYSKRIRIGRNLTGLPLPGSMTRDDRALLEEQVATALADLPQRFEHYSLTPGNPKQIDSAAYQAMIDDHLFFKPMDEDPYLAAANIAGNWPVGRAAFVAADQQTIIWVNEEDHLRLMVVDRDLSLAGLLAQLQALEIAFLASMQEHFEMGFATNDRLGFITSCPTNIGTAMRASVHIPLPNLIARHGMEGVETRADELGLAVRGLGGEHTGAGEDGMVDLSPKVRLGVSPYEIIARLEKGIDVLLAAEGA